MIPLHGALRFPDPFLTVKLNQRPPVIAVAVQRDAADIRWQVLLIFGRGKPGFIGSQCSRTPGKAPHPMRGNT